MADTEIPGLTAQAGLDGTEQFHIVDASGNSRKLTMDDLKTFINTDPSVVPSSEPYRGARVKRTSNLSIATGSVVTVTWQAEDRDTDGIWSVGAPTRLVVPTGVTKVRLRANTAWSTETNDGRYVWMTKNGSSFDGRGYDARAVYGTNNANIASDVIDVVGGDYFELQVFHGAGSNRTLASGTNLWFAMEVVEAS